MKTEINRRRLLSLFCILISGLFFLIVSSASFASLSNLTNRLPVELLTKEKRGKLIYLEGNGGSGGEIVALLGSEALELPATSFPCSNCHGIKGQGTNEGGLQPPPINWVTLSAKHTSALTSRTRKAYTDETVAKAIRSGVDPSGAPLHPGMPRYQMTDAQMSDLISYIKKIGDDADNEPGVSESDIKIGAVLPLSGPLAQIGEDVKATLNAYFAEVNAKGGIYGRKFDLIVEDSQGNPQQTVAATARLIEKEGVFALVGSFEPKGCESTDELIARSGVPLVGPLTLSPHLSLPPNKYVFYLLPSFNDQAKVLVDFVSSKSAGKPARIAVVYSKDDLASDALAGLKSQAKIYSMEIVGEHASDPGRFSAVDAVAAIQSKKPDYLFFFGGAADLTSLAGEIQRAKLNVTLLSSVTMIGRAAFTLPASVAGKTILSYPTSLPDQKSLADFNNTLMNAKVDIRNSAFQRSAYAAARILVEATKLSGRDLSRASLINALEQLQNFQTGVIPPVTFGPNRRIGAMGSYIVWVDINNGQYVPFGGWMTPKDR